MSCHYLKKQQDNSTLYFIVGYSKLVLARVLMVRRSRRLGVRSTMTSSAAAGDLVSKVDYTDHLNYKKRPVEATT